MNEIETGLEAARRLRETARRERLMGSVECAADSAINACEQYEAIVKAQQREIARLERELAPMVKSQPRGVKAGCFDV